MTDYWSTDLESYDTVEVDQYKVDNLNEHSGAEQVEVDSLPTLESVAPVERSLLGEIGARFTKGAIGIAETFGKAGASVLSGGLARGLTLDLYDKVYGVDSEDDRGEWGHALAQQVEVDRLTYEGMGEIYQDMAKDYQASESVSGSIFEDKSLMWNPKFVLGGVAEIVPSMLIPLGLGASSAYKGVQAGAKAVKALGGGVTKANSTHVARLGHALINRSNALIPSKMNILSSQLGARTLAGGLGAGGMEGLGTGEEIYSRGGNTTEALAGTLTKGMASTMLNSLSLGRMLTIGQGKSKALDTALASVTEAITEGSEEVVGASIGLLIDTLNGEDRTLYEEGARATYAEAIKAGFEVGYLSLFAGGAMAGGARPIRGQLQATADQIAQAENEYSAIRRDGVEGVKPLDYDGRYTSAGSLSEDSDLATATVPELLQAQRDGMDVSEELAQRELKGIDLTVGDEATAFEAFKKLHPELGDATYVPTALSNEFHAFSEVTKNMGTKVMLFEGDTSVKGMAVGSTILINASSADKFATVLGHEVGHVAKSKHPDVYAKLESLIDTGSPQFNDYKVRLDKARADIGASPASVALVQEEIINDMLGDMFPTKEFWEEVNNFDGGNVASDLLDIAQGSLSPLVNMEGIISMSSDATLAMRYGAELVGAQLNISDIEKQLGLLGATDDFQGYSTASEEEGVFKYVNASGEAVFDVPKGYTPDQKASYKALKEAESTLNPDVARGALGDYLKSRWRSIDSEQAVANQKIDTMLALATDEEVLAGIKRQGGSNAEFMVNFHGTPHVLAPEKGFPHGRFRLDKIGTGEGAQAFGWGIYFADSKGVARSYRDKLTKRTSLSEDQLKTSLADAQSKEERLTLHYYGEDGIQDWSQELPDDLRDAIGRRAAFDSVVRLGVQGGEARLKATRYDRINFTAKERSYSREGYRWMQENASEIKGEALGSLYEMDIPDSAEANLLDLDKTLEQQPEIWAKVKKGLGDELIQTIEEVYEAERPSHNLLLENGELTGHELVKTLQWWAREGALPNETSDGVDSPKKAVSEFLLREGISGSRFLDGNSRRRGEGNRNTIIWDQKVLDEIALLKNNGKELDHAMMGEAIFQRDDGVNYSIDMALDMTEDTNKFQAPSHEFSPSVDSALDFLYNNYIGNRDAEGAMKRIVLANNFLAKKNPKTREDLTNLMDEMVSDKKDGEGIGTATADLMKIILRNPDPEQQAIQLEAYLTEKGIESTVGADVGPDPILRRTQREVDAVLATLPEKERTDPTFVDAVTKVMATDAPSTAENPQIQREYAKTVRKLAKTYVNHQKGTDSKVHKAKNTMYRWLASDRHNFDQLSETTGNRQISILNRQMKGEVHLANYRAQQRMEKLKWSGAKPNVKGLERVREMGKSALMWDTVRVDANASNLAKYYLGTNPDRKYEYEMQGDRMVLTGYANAESKPENTIDGKKYREDTLKKIHEISTLDTSLFTNKLGIAKPTHPDWVKMFKTIETELSVTTATNIRMSQTQDFGGYYEVYGQEYISLREQVYKGTEGVLDVAQDADDLRVGTSVKDMETLAKLVEAGYATGKYSEKEAKLTAKTRAGKAKKFEAMLDASGLTAETVQEWSKLNEQVKAERKEMSSERKKKLARFEKLDAEFRKRQPSFNDNGKRRQVPFDEMAGHFKTYQKGGVEELRKALVKESWGTQENYWMTEREASRLKINDGPDDVNLNAPKGGTKQSVGNFSAMNRKTGFRNDQQGDILASLTRHVRTAELQSTTRFTATRFLQELDATTLEGSGLNRVSELPAITDSIDYDKLNSQVLSDREAREIGLMVNQTIGLPTSGNASLFTAGVMKMNSLFWKTYPLAVTRALYFNGRNMLYQGQIYGPVANFFRLDDLATAWKDMYLNKRDFEEGLIVNELAQDIDQRQAHMRELQQFDDGELAKRTSNKEVQRFGRTLKVAIEEYSSRALSWGDTSNRNTILRASVYANTNNVRKFIADESFTVDDLMARLKFDTLSDSQKLDMLNLLGPAVDAIDTANPEASLEGFRPFITEMSRNVSENVNLLYATSDRTLIERDINMRPLTGILNYPRATAERFALQGIRPTVNGAVSIADNLQKGIKFGEPEMKDAFRELRTGLGVMGKTYVGAGMSSLVASYLIGDKPDYDDEELRSKATYGFSRSMTWSMGSPGLSNVDFFWETSQDLINAFTAQEEWPAKEISRVTNRVLSMTPFIPDLATGIEAIGNRSGVTNLEAILSTAKLEYPEDSWIEQRTLWQSVQHMIFGTQEVTDPRDFKDKIFTSFELPQE